MPELRNEKFLSFQLRCNQQGAQCTVCSARNTVRTCPRQILYKLLLWSKKHKAALRRETSPPADNRTFNRMNARAAAEGVLTFHTVVSYNYTPTRFTCDSIRIKTARPGSETTRKRSRARTKTDVIVTASLRIPFKQP